MSSTSYQLIAVSQIDPGPNVRHAPCPGADAELTGSIRQMGVQQPIYVVRSGSRYTVIFGARRLRCSVAAGTTHIPAIVLESGMDDGERDAVQIAENELQEKLNPADLCEAIARLIDGAGWPASRVATHLGKSEPTISRLHTIAKGPENVLEQLRDGKLTISAAYSLCRVTDDATRDGLAVQAARGEMNRDELSVAAKAGNTPRPRKPGNWKMFRTVSSGVGVTVFGSDTSYDQLLGVLARFIDKGTTAKSSGIPLTKFLSDFQRGDDREVAA